MGLECSVVIATFNRSSGLKALFESLAAQTLPNNRFEVIVVDDGSTDATWDVISEAQTPFKLRGFRQRNQGPAAARNAAILAAESDLIVTLDDDVVAAPDLLERHLAAHSTGLMPLAAMGVLKLAPDAKLQPWVRWEERGLREQYETIRSGDWDASPRQFYTANASARRESIIEAGLFDPHFRRGEDMELAFRLHSVGITFRLLQEAAVFHRPYRSYEAWTRMAWMYGYYDILLWTKKGRQEIMPSIQDEFRTHRHQATQTMARLMTGGKLASRTTIALAGPIAHCASIVGAARLSEVVYSAIFNLLYYKGAAEALGQFGVSHRILFDAPADSTG